MITAIPMTETRISGHFSRADHFVFLNDQGEVVARCANPALDGECSGKEALLTLLSEQGAERIVVRHVGQKMLGELLERRLEVFRVGHGSNGVADLVDPQARHLMPLTEAGQGRVSLHHEAKQKDGGCGCHHHKAVDDEHAGCCRQKEHNDKQARSHSCGQRKGCCHRQGTEATTGE